MFNDLLSALQKLDKLLEQAVIKAQTFYGSEAANDPYRGLRIDPDEVNRLLDRQPGIPLFAVDTESVQTKIIPLNWLKQTFDLSEFDLDLMLIALAPEIDLRYERLYAYLQDDVTRKRPSVDLALNLLCPSAEAKLLQRVHFAPDAPLIKHGLLHLIPDPHQVKPPILSYYLKLDDQVIHFLLKQKGLEPRLESWCQLLAHPAVEEKFPIRDEIKRILPKLITQAQNTHQLLLIYFSGLHPAEKRRGAIALAAQLNRQLLIADLPQALAIKEDFDQLLKLLFREACFHNAILYLESLDALQTKEQHLLYKSLLDRLAEVKDVVILSGVQSWVATFDMKGVITVPFPLPDFSQRRIHWQANLESKGIVLSDRQLDTLANRFRLNSEQIAGAVKNASNQALWVAASEFEELPLNNTIQPSLNDLLVAAREQSGNNLTELARKVNSKYNWQDIILPTDQLAQLKEICNQAKYRHIVYDKWGFHRKLSIGKGLNVLFSGPPGTGKTMAAEVIANELQLELYKIDLSQVVSKYIGETEKNLNRIFLAAETANAILLFDEADALFGKRSEVRDSHDRYANIEIGYLLQKMEEYEGISILTTNLRQNLDEAFVRRLAFTVHFPSPDEASRRQIWEGIWTEEIPLSPDIDFDFLARQFKLSGGNIKNIALAAAFLAAEADSAVMMEHLLQGIRREYQKMGKVWDNVLTG
ncbi:MULTISPECIES: ATP-binding protein [unclassified Okeania]|uniref:ATP-binding protein n=1 Tax=unclassified Okeania TaxID=2634635 RepID=UPI0013B78A4E|nr:MULTISPECIES: AAA family ATPase [unclassified Okeania]NES77318.1 ATP-binding protein [Okeania sp. SIO1H4]NET13044.1 ATP-binding protein [Okeania sp. SIO1H6]NET22706.1 ATP-binding protein [Okeania sp. SIO1H5]NET95828.1 ATP-binding protein [Okeania sp. SIO1H2]